MVGGTCVDIDSSMIKAQSVHAWLFYNDCDSVSQRILCSMVFRAVRYALQVSKSDPGLAHHVYIPHICIATVTEFIYGYASFRFCCPVMNISDGGKEAAHGQAFCSYRHETARSAVCPGNKDQINSSHIDQQGSQVDHHQEAHCKDSSQE